MLASLFCHTGTNRHHFCATLNTDTANTKIPTESVSVTVLIWFISLYDQISLKFVSHKIQHLSRQQNKHYKHIYYIRHYELLEILIRDKLTFIYLSNYKKCEVKFGHLFPLFWTTKLMCTMATSLFHICSWCT